MVRLWTLLVAPGVGVPIHVSTFHFEFQFLIQFYQHLIIIKLLFGIVGFCVFGYAI